MKQTLEQYGWYLYHQCTCGGSLKQKFKHPNKPGQEFHLRPNQNKWFYLISKRVYDQGPGNTLEAKLKTV